MVSPDTACWQCKTQFWFPISLRNHRAVTSHTETVTEGTPDKDTFPSMDKKTYSCICFGYMPSFVNSKDVGVELICLARMVLHLVYQHHMTYGRQCALHGIGIGFQSSRLQLSRDLILLLCHSKFK